MLKLDYRDNLKLYKKRLLVFNILRSYILSFILYTYLIYIFKCDTIYNVLVLLKQKVTLLDYA